MKSNGKSVTDTRTAPADIERGVNHSESILPAPTPQRHMLLSSVRHWIASANMVGLYVLAPGKIRDRARDLEDAVVYTRAEA